MNNQPPSLIHAMRETCSEEENVYTSLDLAEHETSDWRHPPPLFLLQSSSFPPCDLIFPLTEYLQLVFVIVWAQNDLTWPDIRKCVRKVPSLEDFFIDMVAMISPDKCLRFPTLLEEGRPGLFESDHAGFTVWGTNFLGLLKRATVEVEKVSVVPCHTRKTLL